MSFQYICRQVHMSWMWLSWVYRRSVHKVFHLQSFISFQISLHLSILDYSFQFKKPPILANSWTSLATAAKTNHLLPLFITQRYQVYVLWSYWCLSVSDYWQLTAQLDHYPPSLFLFDSRIWVSFWLSFSNPTMISPDGFGLIWYLTLLDLSL